MSLFPAYGGGGSEGGGGGSGGELHLVEDDSRGSGSSSATERRLLASDEEEPGATGATLAPPSSSPADCYRDARRDLGNMRVSTLYYPGRPDYTPRGDRALLGGGVLRPPGRRRPRARARRYYEGATGHARLEPAAVEARARELRAALAARPPPHREVLALEYVRWSREVRGEGAALEAAREAVVACPARRVRDALQRAREAALPPSGALSELRAELAAARGDADRLDAWERVIEAVGPAYVTSLGGAALDAGPPAWYPRVLHAVGRSLRAAGHWERLVLLVELAAAMNFPPGAGDAVFPPAEDEARGAARERDLADKEEKVSRSGLPRGTVWARVERLRAEARWRAGAGGEEDPQRRPGAPELAACMRAAPPASAPALHATLLLLARVPPLPASDAVSRALPCEPESGEALASMLRAARRLPPAHAARPAPETEPSLRATLATLLDPPHYFSDSTGFLSWVSSLWEASCAWAAPGEARAALVAWRLRWLHALGARAQPAEARRLRAEGRGVVRRWAARDARAHALLARLDAPEGGARTALRATRVALATHAPAEHALYAARVLSELVERGSALAQHALVAAALRRPLPEDASLASPPDAADVAAAHDEASRRCAEYERQWREQGEHEEEGEDVVAALLPAAAGEWVAARVALAGPAERARLERHVAAAAARGEAAGRGRRRYLEHAACALAVHAAAEGRLAAVAAAMLPAFPENAMLALACAGAPLWARPALAWPDSHAAALARVVPALLRAPAPLHGEGAERTARACARAGGGARGGGAALVGIALAAAAGGGGHAAEATALAAVSSRPHHKWVSVRAATAAPQLAPSLADALLERELRAHALIDELDRPDNS